MMSDLRAAGLAALSIVVFAGLANAQTYELVISGGRVMDPESGLDAVRDVGIIGGKIAAISETPLSGAETISADGLVVAPGFIDLHAHGQNAESRPLQAGDGVTTALELEIGVYPVDEWYASQEGTSIINYGATVGHLPVRIKVLDGIEVGHTPTMPMSERAALASAKYVTRTSTEEEIEEMGRLLQRGLDEGALGVGYGIAYAPVASHREIYETFKVAGANGATCYVHMRASDAFSDDESIGAVQEVIANAVATGASLHIVHLNSSGGRQAKTGLELIRGARERGVDVTTEVYPYIASSTLLQSALFDGDWEGKSGLKYGDIMWVQTGERLNSDTFQKYRKIGGWVVIFGMDPEIVAWLVSRPDVIIASDGIPFVNGLAHPRGAGTFSRFLGHYVRDENAMSLMDALRKITLMPAQRVEKAAPQMKNKGRIRVGADADITVFDADTILDRATFTEPAQFSAGVAHVLVGGEFVVRDYAVVEGVAPGKPVRGPIDSAPEVQ